MCSDHIALSFKLYQAITLQLVSLKQHMDHFIEIILISTVTCFIPIFV